jgi:hypothetical protein
MIGIIATLFGNGSYFSQSLATSFSYHGGSQSRLKSAHAARILIAAGRKPKNLRGARGFWVVMSSCHVARSPVAMDLPRG